MESLSSIGKYELNNYISVFPKKFSIQFDIQLENTEVLLTYATTSVPFSISNELRTTRFYNSVEIKYLCDDFLRTSNL